MKSLIYCFCTALLLGACTSVQHPDYAKNLATAQKYFELHEVEDLEAQMEMLSPEVKHDSPFYNGKISNYDGVVGMLKGYHDSFENIKYTAQNWLPGTDSLGNLDGSVRTYGRWTGTQIMTGKQLDLRSYHYMNFDAEGKIVQTGDFFDGTGMLNAVYPKNLVVATMKVADGNLEKVMEYINNDKGLSYTRKYDGCLGVELTFNEATNTIYIIENWASNEQFAAYFKWRQEEDTNLANIIPLLVGGEAGFSLAFPNSKYESY